MTEHVEGPRTTRVFSPAVDIEEGRDDLVLWADLPGVKQDELRITLERKVLTIEATVEMSARPTHQLVHQEFQQGTFRRPFTISDAIDERRISATLTNGVLQLVLPKVEPAKPRNIVVNVVE